MFKYISQRVVFPLVSWSLICERSFLCKHPCRTLLQKSEVPWSPMTLWRNSPKPRGKASGVVKCLMFWWIIASCISEGVVRIFSLPSFWGTPMLVMDYFCIEFKRLWRYLYSRRSSSLSSIILMMISWLVWPVRLCSIYIYIYILNDPISTHKRTSRRHHLNKKHKSSHNTFNSSAT